MNLRELVADWSGLKELQNNYNRLLDEHKRTIKETADLVFDRPVPDKWEGLALLVLLGGLALFIITLPIMLLTGQPVE